MPHLEQRTVLHVVREGLRGQLVPGTCHHQPPCVDGGNTVQLCNYIVFHTSGVVLTLFATD
jgi:hypothetical protein